jgi:subtilisin family serine protease
VAGVIASQGVVSGVAPESDLYIVKALGDNGEGTDKSVADGIDWLVDQDVDIISMSLGSNQSSPLIHKAIRRAYEKNIICVCASGNDSQGRIDVESIDFPAAYNETIAVGAVDVNSHLSNFSSIGNVDIVAFGVNVLSTFKNNSYAILSGTSMATPYISGVIALMQSLAKTRLGRRLTYEEVHVILNLNAHDLGKEGKDKLYGYGEFSF